MNRKLKLKSTILLLAFTAFTPGISLAESLSATLSAAQDFSPARRNAELNVGKAEAQSAQTKALQRGTVTATLGAGLNNFNGYSTLMPHELYKPTSVGVTYSVPLYTGGRLDYLLQAAILGERVSKDSKRDVDQQVLLNAGAAYLAVAKAADLVKLSDNQRQLLATELAQAKGELSAGIRTKTDVAQAQARLFGANAKLELAQASLKEALANYESLVGRAPVGEIMNPGLTLDIEQSKYVTTVLSNSPLIHASNSKVAQAEVSYSAVKAEDGPTLQLNMGVSTDRQNNPMLMRESSQQIGLQLSVPLYEGGKSQARKSLASLNIGSAKADKELLVNELKAQAVAAWESYAGILAQEEAIAEQLDAAKLALRGVRAEYRVGTRTLLDILNAEQELLEVETSTLKLSYQKSEVVLRMRALMGALTA